MNKELVDRIFYLVYNFYYKNGNYKNGYFLKFIPWHYTIFILSFGTTVWGMFLYSASVFYLKSEFINKSYMIYFFGFYLLIFSFYYSLFISKSRYQIIYERYKNDKRLDKLKSFFAIFVLIVLPLILIILFSLIWHKIL
jgi:hypothetical protein